MHPLNGLSESPPYVCTQAVGCFFEWTEVCVEGVRPYCNGSLGRVECDCPVDDPMFWQNAPPPPPPTDGSIDFCRYEFEPPCAPYACSDFCLESGCITEDSLTESDECETSLDCPLDYVCRLGNCVGIQCRIDDDCDVNGGEFCGTPGFSNGAAFLSMCTQATGCDYEWADTCDRGVRARCATLSSPGGLFVDCQCPLEDLRFFLEP